VDEPFAGFDALAGAGVLEEVTAVTSVATTRSTETVITARSPGSPPGKSARRRPNTTDTTIAQATRTAAAM
jgi:hypothetical protein